MLARNHQQMNRRLRVEVFNGRNLVGIVTDRDIRSFLSDGLLTDLDAREKRLANSVAAIMTPEPVFVAPDDDLQDAVELLMEQKFGAIPVVDEAEGLVGIVSYVDVLRCFLNRLQEE